MGRKRIRRRVAQVLNALEQLPQKTLEQKRAERAAARLERARIRTEAQELRAREAAAWRVKEAAQAERRHESWKKFAPTIGKEAREPFDGNLTISVQPPAALAELAPAPTSGPVAPTLPAPSPASHADEFLSEVRYDSEGKPRRVPVRGRDGLPLRTHPTAPAKTAGTGARCRATAGRECRAARDGRSCAARWSMV